METVDAPLGMDVPPLNCRGGKDAQGDQQIRASVDLVWNPVRQLVTHTKSQNSVTDLTVTLYEMSSLECAMLPPASHKRGRGKQE